MLMNEVPIKQKDGYTTILYPYYADTASVRGSILILHGMAEHHSRYIPFTEFLTRRGYDVFLFDHRGHGTDKKYEDLGFFSTHQGAQKIVQDVITILDFVNTKQRGEELILFGHSMGSFIARVVIQQYSEIDRVILSGTPHPSSLALLGGRFISSIIQTVKGPRYPSKFLNNMMFGSKLYKAVCTRTAYDWLTRNNTIVGQYINDPFCGFICTSSMYHDMFLMLTQATSVSAIKKTRRELPILIISGEEDPVGGCGKDVYRYFSLLTRLGFKNADCILYAECRHELLNEINRKKIMQDVLQWMISDKIDDEPNKTEVTITTEETKMNTDATDTGSTKVNETE